MSDDAKVKITAIICLAVILAIVIIYARDEPQIWGSTLGLLSLVIGGGTAGKNAVKHVLRIDK